LDEKWGSETILLVHVRIDLDVEKYIDHGFGGRQRERENTYALYDALWMNPRRGVI